LEQVSPSSGGFCWLYPYLHFINKRTTPAKTAFHRRFFNFNEHIQRTITMTEQASLQVTINDNLSIADLVQLHDAGASVMRSAHVGNFSPYNLAIAQAGLPMLLVDHTITGRLDPDMKGVDRNYFPEGVVSAAGNRIIADAGSLVCRTATRLDTSVFVDEFHTAAIQAVIPEADLVTNTNYLRANESVAGEIVCLAAKIAPGLFQRVAESDGSVSRRDRAADLISRLGVMQLNDDPRAAAPAVLIPNEVDIVANFIIEALNSDQATQYHLSGPDMIDYLVNRQTGGGKPDLLAIKALYEQVRQSASFGPQLPAELNVQLVSSTEARFATTMARRAALDNLLEAVSANEVVQAQTRAKKKDFFASSDAQNRELRSEFEIAIGVRTRAAEADLVTAMQAVPEQFVAPRNLGFVTQYDVANEGGLYVPPINRERNMSELRLITASMTKVRKRLRL
jgi:hypothetical protein